MPAAAVFVVLYTAHLTQKRKKWYDGKCKFYLDSSKVRLMDDEGRPLAERAWQDGMPEAGTTVQFPRFMVELDELESTIESPVRPAPPVRPNIANKRPRPRGLPLSILLRDSKVRLNPRAERTDYEGIDQHAGGQAGQHEENQLSGSRYAGIAGQYVGHYVENQAANPPVVNEHAGIAEIQLEGQLGDRSDGQLGGQLGDQFDGQLGDRLGGQIADPQHAEGPFTGYYSEYAEPFAGEQAERQESNSGSVQAPAAQARHSDPYTEHIYTDEYPLENHEHTAILADHQHSDHMDYIYSDDAEHEWLDQPHTYSLPSDLESDVELVDVVNCDRRSVFENMPTDLATTGPWTKEAYLLFSWHPPLVKSEPI